MQCGSHSFLRRFTAFASTFTAAEQYLRFEYVCCPKADNQPCRHDRRQFMATPWVAIGSDSHRGNLNYLDRVALHCPNNGIVSYFRIENDVGSHIRYAFQCCWPEASSGVTYQCDSAQGTICKNTGLWNPYYLNQHDVDCGEGKFLNYLYAFNGWNRAPGRAEHHTGIWCNAYEFMWVFVCCAA